MDHCKELLWNITGASNHATHTLWTAVSVILCVRDSDKQPASRAIPSNLCVNTDLIDYGGSDRIVEEGNMKRIRACVTGISTNKAELDMVRACKVTKNCAPIYKGKTIAI